MLAVAMQSNDTTPRAAWQPFTLAGVAAFAHASFGRLAWMQTLFAALSAASALVVFQRGWEPSIRKAIEQLPAQGGIRNGQLHWTEPSPQNFGQGTFVSFAVDLAGTNSLGRVADFEFTLTRNELRCRWLLGEIAMPYPPEWKAGVNRPVLEPWWGAWQASVLAGIAGGVFVGVIASWLVLATLYALPVRLLAFYVDQATSLAGAWRMAAAALLPGAAFLNAALVAYGFGRLSLVQLLAAFAAHIPIGWVYAALAPGKLPRVGGAPGFGLRSANPFAAPPESEKPGDQGHFQNPPEPL